MKIKSFNQIFDKKHPILVAEISANHVGKISNAKKLIDIAKKYGADAVKLQTYKPSTMTINSKKKYFKIKEGLWKDDTLWNLYKKAHTPYEWHQELFNHAKKKKIICFSTPFDESAVDLLEDLKCPLYKISSFEMNDIPLIKYIAKTKKPIIISTGMADLSEINNTFKYVKKFGIKDVTLLYCVSNYPSKIEDFNLKNIEILKKKFKCRIGFSDHSTNSIVASTAVALGAEIVEKHIALEGQNIGPDIKFSIKGKQIKKFKHDLINAYLLKGENKFKRNISEKKSIQFQRSIFSVKKIKKGEKFSKDNIKRIRPGYGLAPVNFFKILNKRSKKNIDSGEPIKKNYIKN
jgi:pseudaminic acid synthase